MISVIYQIEARTLRENFPGVDGESLRQNLNHFLRHHNRECIILLIGRGEVVDDLLTTIQAKYGKVEQSAR